MKENLSHFSTQAKSLKLPKSIRKFIRKEKARIRREVFDLKEQEKLINQLYQRFSKKYENKRNISTSNSNGN
jgi:hypothetical protein